MFSDSIPMGMAIFLAGRDWRQTGTEFKVFFYPIPGRQVPKVNLLQSLKEQFMKEEG